MIGAGAAGLSAALWCDELGLKTLLLEEAAEIGGQLHRVYNPINNHLGARAANGREMLDIFKAQTSTSNFELRTNQKIESVNLTGKKIVLTNGEQLTARAIILATGVSRRALSVPGEREFAARGGVLESSKRDAKTVAGKTVCIVGGGDAACENAVILSETARKVWLVHRRSEFRARPEFLDQIINNPKIEILTDTEISKIIGDKQIAHVELKNRGESFQIPIDALLVRIGVEPNTKLFAQELVLDDAGYIEVNQFCETNVAGVFAVGDAANRFSPTISTAVGMGATAAKALFEKRGK